jgi:hypothetical protein
MLDILEDSTGNLELERFKCKLQDIWMRILDATYTEDDGSREDFMEANALRFADQPQDLLDPKEELDSVKGEGKAPTYKGSSLKSNNEKGKIEATSYEGKHAATKTPGDSKTLVKSNTYDFHSGKIAPRKDARVIRSFSPMVEKMVDELRDLQSRQRAGRNEYRQRL